MMHEAIQAWATRGDRPVTLPSGQRAKIRLRSAVELLRNGAMPDVLRRRAMEYETGGIDAAALSAEDRMSAYDFMRAYVAGSVVALEIEGRWESVRLTVEDLAEIPEDDVSEIQAIVTLRKSALTVTAESEAKLGLGTPEDAARGGNEEAADTVDGWIPFRDGAGGDSVGTDGAAVREVSVAGLPGDR